MNGTDAQNVHAGHRERLRERFLRDGLSSMTERETLELLLMYAIPRQDTSPLAQRLLDRFGSLAGVLEADRDALLDTEGVGAGAATLLSLIPQLLGRYQQSRMGERPRITDPASAAHYAVSLFSGAQEERVYLVCMDLSGRVNAAVLLGRGTLDEVALYPRRVVEEALRSKAYSVLLAHNHPGGTPYPSQADVDSTRKVIAALATVNIRVVDHVVVSGFGAWSMARGGMTEAALPGSGSLHAGSEAARQEKLEDLGWSKSL